MAENDMGTDLNPGERQITLQVRAADGNEVQFKMARTTPLKGVMDSYGTILQLRDAKDNKGQLKMAMDSYSTRVCGEKGIYRFLFKHPIMDNDTPTSLAMEDSDYIDTTPWFRSSAVPSCESSSL